MAAMAMTTLCSLFVRHGPAISIRSSLISTVAEALTILATGIDWRQWWCMCIGNCMQIRRRSCCAQHASATRASIRKGLKSRARGCVNRRSNLRVRKLPHSAHPTSRWVNGEATVHGALSRESGRGSMAAVLFVIGQRSISQSGGPSVGRTGSASL